MTLFSGLKVSTSKLALVLARSRRVKESFILSGTMLALASCGGGGSSSSGTGGQLATGNMITGSVIKGPLQNALVFADYNNDGLLSPGEPSTRTAADGSFSLNSTQSNANFVSISDEQTIDTFTGESVSGVKLKAPAGSTVITPATTILTEIRETNPTASVADVASALGLSGIDLQKFNPFAAGVDANLALVAEKVATQIISTVTSISSAAKGTGADEKTAYDKALSVVTSAVVKEMNDGDSSDSISLTDTTVLNEIKDEAKAQLSNDVSSSTAFSAVLDKSISAVENVNEKIDTAQNLTDNKSKAIFSLDSQLSSQVLTASQNELAGSGSNTIDFEQDSSVDSAVDKTTVTISSSSSSGGGGGGGAPSRKDMVGTTGDDYFTLGSDTETVAGNGGNDTFVILSGKIKISDLSTGDILVVQPNAEIFTDEVTAFVSTSSTSNSGIVAITATESGGTIDMSLASSGGYTLVSGAGVDNLKGGSGNDIFKIEKAGEGNTDTLSGLTGSDTLQLSSGSHVFGSDVNLANIETVLTHSLGSSINLSAQTEDFTITGGAGIDTITGGAGNDQLTGGAGADTFKIVAGSDTITDLTSEDTLIVSSGATANATISANYTAAGTTTNAGIANLTLGTGGLTVNMNLAGGSAG
ncbi:MAG: calcium-binding protein, partial [Paracoccaceae bacterium]|nr:calcium-binding protein [Paracoccaceae bacterium]